MNLYEFQALKHFEKIQLSLLKSLSLVGSPIKLSTECMIEPNYTSSLYFFSNRGSSYFSFSVKNEKSLVDWRDCSFRILG
jgi:hypothetical protein